MEMVSSERMLRGPMNAFESELELLFEMIDSKKAELFQNNLKLNFMFGAKFICVIFLLLLISFEIKLFWKKTHLVRVLID